MDVNEIISELKLNAEYDAVQKGKNCAVLTYLFFTNINILRGVLNSKSEEFNKFTSLYFVEFHGDSLKLLSRELGHELVISLKEDPFVVLLKFCIALYGLLSVASEIFVNAKSYFYVFSEGTDVLTG